MVALLLAARGGWLVFDERRDLRASRVEIAEACDGLVEPDAVLDLNGGAVRVAADHSVWEGGEASRHGAPRWSCEISPEGSRRVRPARSCCGLCPNSPQGKTGSWVWTAPSTGARQTTTGTT